MRCLKCGCETNQTFCEECRKVMAKYPVKPGTIVQIPKGRAPKKAAPRRISVPLETKLAKQQKLIRNLIILLACMLVLIGAMSAAIFHLWKGTNVRPKGQNYTTVTKPTAEPITEPENP